MIKFHRTTEKIRNLRKRLIKSQSVGILTKSIMLKGCAIIAITFMVANINLPLNANI